MSISLKAAMGIAGLAVATTAAAQVTFYSHEDFQGQQFSTDRTVHNMDRVGFNDRAASAVVKGGSWQVCQDAEFSGRCIVLQPGEYRSLANMGLQNEISSVRPVEGRYGYNDKRNDRAYVAQGYDRNNGPAQGYDRDNDNGAVQGYDRDNGGAQRSDYRRRGDEQLFDAPVTSVHAVVGPPEQRCWVEHREFQSNANVPGAIAGAVIGGVLGHQIGGGRGRDVATAGGAVAGAAIGANVGRDEGDAYGREVQRCTNVTQYDRPDYWDVAYTFGNQEHHVQMTSPPGSTITVNRDGEPRL